ncbi:MAG: hypothetical protein JWM28_4325, partial [Chitinophagaceae bacterium]|nr:hypothetical protein [Chitinophagaceae bacterium]
MIAGECSLPAGNGFTEPSKEY